MSGASPIPRSRPAFAIALQIIFCTVACLALWSLWIPQARAQSQISTGGAWSFSLTPYLWLPSVDATLQFERVPGSVGGDQVSISADQRDLLNALDFAVMVGAELRRDRLFFLTDIVYINLSGANSAVRSGDFVGLPRDPVSTSLDTGAESNLRGTLWTLAGGYTLAGRAWGHLDAFGGLRYFGLQARTDTRLSAAVQGPRQDFVLSRSGRLSRDADLWDGIVGLRGRIALGGGFSLPFLFDVGTGSSRITWQAMGGIAYRVGWADVGVGYRHLSYEQDGSGLVQDLSFSGPYLSVRISF